MRKMGALPVLNYFRIFTLLAAVRAAALAISLLELATHDDKFAQAAQTDQRTAADFQEQVVNGQPADQGEYPAQGALLFYDSYSQEYYQGCGGTLVDSIHYLTAAHCVVDDFGNHTSPQEMLIVLGEVDLRDIDQGEIYGVSAAETNASYNPQTQQYDVAMLTLSSPSSLTPTRVVNSNETYLWSPGVLARIIGWGTIYSDGPAPSWLLEANAPIVSDDDCTNA